MSLTTKRPQRKKKLRLRVRKSKGSKRLYLQVKVKDVDLETLLTPTERALGNGLFETTRLNYRGLRARRIG